ncbi:MBL fold metallo-hydrolase [Nitratireductor pacificus]|uniref:Beta-lactamase domain-containing protein n=1 Tax=Nitratireductor pacificus pht-3B TaxID=391937 RepID=K2MB55_9HYPH|nr:MBL fold metallo-hydrolase [Nitratireductor pacificus]EKF18100.1 beta-lactamase domain-containing protein [Nitratireductor pacificus pht-3B]
MSEAFASVTDMAEQKPQAVELGPNVYGYCSAHDPNCGFIVGDEAVIAIDARATPALAREMIADIRTVTDRPIKYLFMTHYHAVRALGASAFEADLIFSSLGTLQLLRERGQADMDSEIGRFPRLFKGREEIPGLTMPHASFEREFTFWLGGREIRFQHLGRAHTRGDTICHVPDAGVVFAGDIVENHCGVYMGDGYLGDWLETLERLRAVDAVAAVPGRGAPMQSRQAITEAIDSTKDFIATILNAVRHGLSRGHGLKGCYEIAKEHCDPRFGDWPIYQHVLAFDTARAFDELRGMEHPQIWTDERDQALWKTIHA